MKSTNKALLMMEKFKNYPSEKNIYIYDILQRESLFQTFPIILYIR
jgi:hypothetical protein